METMCQDFYTCQGTQIKLYNLNSTTLDQSFSQKTGSFICEMGGGKSTYLIGLM